MDPKSFGLLDALMAQPLIWLLFVVLILKPSNYLIQRFIKRAIRRMLNQKPDIDAATIDERVDRLYKDVVRAGDITGDLERVIVLLLVLLDQFQAVA